MLKVSYALTSAIIIQWGYYHFPLYKQHKSGAQICYFLAHNINSSTSNWGSSILLADGSKTPLYGGPKKSESGRTEVGC